MKTKISFEWCRYFTFPANATSLNSFTNGVFLFILCPPFELGSDLLNIEPLCRKPSFFYFFELFNCQFTLLPLHLKLWWQFDDFHFCSKKRCNSSLELIWKKIRTLLVLFSTSSTIFFLHFWRKFISSKYQRNNKFFFRIFL
jgi:hypothetical protein